MKIGGQLSQQDHGQNDLQPCSQTEKGKKTENNPNNDVLVKLQFCKIRYNL